MNGSNYLGQILRFDLILLGEKHEFLLLRIGRSEQLIELIRELNVSEIET